VGVYTAIVLALALAWVGAVFVTGSGLGVVAWGIGVAVGIAVAKSAGSPSAETGARAALLTLLSILLAKALIFTVALRPIVAGELLDAPQALTTMFMDDMVTRHAFSSELQATLDSMEHAQGDTSKATNGLALSMRMMAEAGAATRTASSSERERIIRANTDAVLAKETTGARLGRLFSAWDALCIALGLLTARRLGRGKSQ
jgi:hypothetical protein